MQANGSEPIIENADLPRMDDVLAASAASRSSTPESGANLMAPVSVEENPNLMAPIEPGQSTNPPGNLMAPVFETTRATGL